MLPWCLLAQRKAEFAVLEDSIIHIHQQMLSEPIMENRYQMNEQLLYLFEEVLGMKNSFHYKFDSLKTISVLTSPDKNVRLFTWYVLDDRNNCECFGFLQAYSEQQKRYLVFPLTDRSKKISNPSSQRLTHNSWFGAMYYKLLQTEYGGKTYYTLLGWSGGNMFSQYKVIEVLSLSNKGTPTFGAPLFKGYNKTKPMRIIFEYVRKGAKLQLDYSREYYSKRSEKKDKKTNKYTYDTIPADMIIFNRLIPLDESLAKIPQYYVPESSWNDAFMETDGRWVFKPGVEGRNKDNKELVPREHKNREYYKPVE